MDMSVTKTGAAWYGRNAVRTEAVLYSWILEDVKTKVPKELSHCAYLNLRISHSTALIAGMSLSLPPTKRKNASTLLSSSAFSAAVNCVRSSS